MTTAAISASSPDAVKLIATPEPFAGLFAKRGIAAVTYAHKPVFTVEEGVGFRHLIPGGHTKNLFLKDKKDKYWLVTALDKTVIDLKKLPEKIGAGRLSFGSPERLMAALGVTPGSVTALAVVNDAARQVTPVLDKALFAHETVNCHPLQNDKTTGLKPQDLLIFMKDLGYDPLIIDFSAL